MKKGTIKNISLIIVFCFICLICSGWTNIYLLDLTEIEEIVLCEQPNVLKVFQIIGYALFVLKILVPLLLIILGTKDFAYAVISSNEKANKEALNKLIMRIIIGVAIFFIPTVLNFALTLVDDAVETTSEFSKCTTCLLDPGECEKADEWMDN